MGDVLAVTPLEANKTVGDGDKFEFAVGAFTVTVA